MPVVQVLMQTMGHLASVSCLHRAWPAHGRLLITTRTAVAELYGTWQGRVKNGPHPHPRHGEQIRNDSEAPKRRCEICVHPGVPATWYILIFRLYFSSLNYEYRSRSRLVYPVDSGVIMGPQVYILVDPRSTRGHIRS